MAVYVAGPLMIPLVVVYCWLGISLQQYNMSLLRELTRLKAITSSPVIQNFSEAMYGTKTIRAHQLEGNLARGFEQSLDDYLKNTISIVASKQWFSLRIQVVSLLIVLPSIVIAIVVQKVDSGQLAILLVYMMSLSNDVKRLLNNMSNMENRFVSFERCHYFMNIPPEEGYKHLEELKKGFESQLRSNFASKAVAPKHDLAGWPSEGSLELDNYSVKYRADLDYVLRKVSFNIEGGTKLGILGRTGAGKSTLISSIFRYFNSFEGEILIDGVKIRDIDLQTLRRAITIIPQDPILFNSSLKRNLDPTDSHSDQEVEKVLREINLWEKFQDHGGVQFAIDSAGANLSQGEKQLICFGRSILENNKLILMDEATANIDQFTEKTIQRLIEEKFSQSSIVMIAHKLNTIMICNKILILDHGKVIEFGDLQELKEKEGGVLNALLKSADLIKEYC